MIFPLKEIRISLTSSKESPYPKLEKIYKPASGSISGLKIINKVDNTGSIDSSLNEYYILEGIREVPMKFFDGPKSVFYAKNDMEHSKELAEKIKQNKKISPLIIVHDNEGAYILEGAHRYVALYFLGVKTLPALVVVDEELYEE